MPRSRDRLKSRQRNGAKTSAFFFSSQVGSGLDRHHLSGSDCTSSETSSVVTGRNAINELAIGHGVNDGGSALAVAANTPATLSSK